jgi:hypothetical protein
MVLHGQNAAISAISRELVPDATPGTWSTFKDFANSYSIAASPGPSTQCLPLNTREKALAASVGLVIPQTKLCN